VRTDLRQPAAANKIIDNFDIIITTTNIVDLIVYLLLKSKAYSHFIPSTQLQNKHMCVDQRNHNHRCDKVTKLGATDGRIGGCKPFIIDK
jgi:hypothetical protein